MRKVTEEAIDAAACLLPDDLPRRLTATKSQPWQRFCHLPTHTYTRPSSPPYPAHLQHLGSRAAVNTNRETNQHRIFQPRSRIPFLTWKSHTPLINLGSLHSRNLLASVPRLGSIPIQLLSHTTPAASLSSALTRWQVHGSLLNLDNI